MTQAAAKSRVVLDADAMKLIVQPKTTEQKIFETIAGACGSFVISDVLKREYKHAVLRSGGTWDDLARRLSDLPESKRVDCRASALKAAEANMSAKAVEALPVTDRHLLRTAVTESATYIVSNDSGVLDSACRKLARAEHGITICTPDEFWARCEESGKNQETERT